MWDHRSLVSSHNHHLVSGETTVGAMSMMYPKETKSVFKWMSCHLLPDAEELVVLPELGDHAGILGCVALGQS